MSLSDSGRNIKCRIEVEVRPSAGEIAEVFWAMNAEEQAYFLNILGEKDRLVFQLQAIADSPHLTQSGRLAMSRIGEYSEEGRS